MPQPPKRGKAGPAALGAAGLAPLAIALLVGNATIPSKGSKVVSTDPVAAAQCEEGIENFHECHASYPSGCSPTGKYDGYLNYLKNQNPPRDSKPALVFTSLNDYHDLESRTPKELGKSNHADLKDQLAAMGEGHPAAVIGYLYYVKQEGAESSNCELTAPEDTDYHIGIGFDKSVAASGMPHAKPTAADKTALKQTAAVVEMTPQYRDSFALEWTIDAVKAVLGKQVKVIGQLMADNEHNVTKDNCGLAGHGENCWRASIWELHPVTSFQVCTLKDGLCTQNGPGWADIGDAVAAEDATAATKK
jgi:hypothetical protein